MPIGLNNDKFTVELSSGTNYLALPIGSIVPVWSNITGITIPPTTNFIILSKGLTGSGAYNQNKLTDQATITVSTNVRRYTAVINDATSPIYNQTVALINSTEVSNTAGAWINLPSVLGATDSLSTVFYQNQFQGHRFNLGNSLYDNESIDAYAAGGSNIAVTYYGRTQGMISDTVNGTPRTGTQTRQDTYSAIYYMRYK